MLKHHGQLGSESLELRRALRRQLTMLVWNQHQFFARHIDATQMRSFKQIDASQQRAFTGPRAANDGDDIARKR